MFFTSNVEYAIAAEDLLHESITYGAMRNEISAFKHYITTHFNMLLQECDMVMDMYDDPYVLYGEANVGEFFKNLGTKIKAILNKIFEWLKNAIKIIGKILLAPFGVIFKSDGKKDNKSGGASGGASSSDSNSNSSSSSNGSSTSSPISGGITGILGGMGEFDFHYIKDTGFNNLFPVVEVLRNMVDMAEKKSLLSRGEATSMIGEYTKVISADVDVEKLSADYTNLKTITESALNTYYGSIITMMKTDRSKLKEDALNANIKTFRDLYEKPDNSIKGNDVKGVRSSLNTVFNVIGNDNKTKESLYLLMGDRNIDYFHSGGLEKTGEDITSLIELKAFLLNAVIDAESAEGTANANDDKPKSYTAIIDLIVGYYTSIIADNSGNDSANSVYQSFIEGAKKLKDQAAAAKTNETAAINFLKDTIKLLEQTNISVSTIKAESSTVDKRGRKKIIESTTTERASSVAKNSGSTSSFGVVGNEGEYKTFTVNELLYSSIGYKVNIATTTWKELIGDTNSLDNKKPGDKAVTDIKGMMVKMSNVLETLTNQMSEINKKDEALAKPETTVSFKTTTTDAEGKVVQNTKQSPEFVKQVVEISRAALKSLKDDITTLINQFSDMEKHQRLCLYSLYLKNFAVLTFELQNYFIAENIMAEAIFKQRERNNTKRVAADIDKSEAAKKKNLNYDATRAEANDSDTALDNIEEKRSQFYAAVKKIIQ